MKFRMLFLILLFALVNKVTAFEEQFQNVVYLKNGSVINCVILEQSPNEYIKIKTIDGSIFVFKIDEVDKITNVSHINDPITQSNKSSTKDLSLSVLVGGISIPIGDFAKNSGDNAAYAKNGYSVGIIASSFHSDNILIGLSSNLTVNSVDVDKLRQEFSVPSHVDIDVDSYVNFDASLMIGAGSAGFQSRSFIAGLIGASYCTLPRMNISDSYQTISQERDSRLTLCYGLTAGTCYTSGLSVAIKFITMEPEFDVTVNTPDFDVTEKAKQKISYVVVGLGISL